MYAKVSSLYAEKAKSCSLLTASRFLFLDLTMCSLKASLSSWGTFSLSHSCWIFSLRPSHVASFSALRSSSCGAKHHLSVRMLLLDFYIQVQGKAFLLPLELDDTGRKSDSHDRWAVSVMWYFLLKGRTNLHLHTQHPSQSWSLGCGPALPCIIQSAFSEPWTRHAASSVITND